MESFKTEKGDKEKKTIKWKISNNNYERNVLCNKIFFCSFSVPPVLLFLWLLFFWSFKIKNLQNTEKTENVSFVLIATSHTNLCELLVRGWKLKVKSAERLPPLKLTVSTVGGLRTGFWQVRHVITCKDSQSSPHFAIHQKVISGRLRACP